MSDHSEAFVAFDTSKLRNAVAIADGGRAGEVRFLGEIENTGAATAKLVRKLAAKYERLTFCYEAGPTGYGLYRQIKSLGHECIVVAPSLIPKKPGDRVKTNRRDAVRSWRSCCAPASSPRCGFRTASRGDARSDAGARGGGDGFAVEAPAGLGVPAAAGPALSGQEDLDQSAHELAGEPEA